MKIWSAYVVKVHKLTGVESSSLCPLLPPGGLYSHYYFISVPLGGAVVPLDSL